MTRTIKISQIARVEGHGGITVVIDKNKVKDVQVEIYEGPRLIETLVIGKTIDESVSITSRICAICTISHRYAAIRSIERALNIKVPEKATLLRTLMHLGEMIESHSLHVFLLALPDILGYPSAIAMVNEYEKEVISGLLLKKYGTSIMKLISGRKIHGENPIIGGFGKYPSNEELLKIKNEAEKHFSAVENVIKILADYKYPQHFNERSIFMCLNPPNNQYGFVGDTVLISDGSEYSVDDYKKITNERVVPYSFAKRSSYKGKPFMVGAIARINLLGDRLTGKAKEYYKKYFNDEWYFNPLYNNLAQAIEILYCLEKIPEIIDSALKLKDPEIIKPEKKDGVGTSAVEAPRGTLYHHYVIKNLKIVESDIITPTAQNLDNMERHIRMSAEKMINADTKDMILLLEMIARAYDPCISCSAHLVRVIRDDR
ncbi:MAG: Ni/Fe hydrogenase subunit alpha [Candidatus Odinarchaeota archaeon]|nr:Ni/Fe hydrogenase subunit alpha [Candidatus Odinarchaeota archaeon]